MGRLSNALKHAWNTFTNQENSYQGDFIGPSSGVSYGSRPHQVRIRIANERSIIGSIYSRVAVDVAKNEIKHVRAENGKYLEDVPSGLNECLTIEPNIDQGPRAFLSDFVLTLFERGVAAVVPVDTTINPQLAGSWDVKSMRIGYITQWYPRHVRVMLYNDQPNKGKREEVVLEKRTVGIVENPFYAIMNEPNSTLQRLIHKLNLLDTVDELSSSGKLDLIVQLPYVIKSEARREQAEKRRKDIEFQLKSSTYGIAYTDGTEKITQLNRPVTNNLLEQVTYLTSQLYSQLGLTDAILNGTADEKTMLNYFSRIVEPILDALSEELIRKFLTKTARSQGQTILYFKNPFKLIPLSDLAEIADVLSRNEIVSPNELRMAIGMKPADDPAADKLNNSNMPDETGASAPAESDATTTNSAIDEIEHAVDEIFADLGLDEPEEAPDEGG